MHTLMTRLVLGLSALTLLSVGSLMLLAPQVLFGLNGITLDPAPAMMSEIRAPGALVLFAGVMAALGIFNRNFTRAGLALSAATLLSYGLGRFVSIGMDGIPPEGLIGALAVELGLGVACGLLLWSPKPSASGAHRPDVRLQAS